MPRPARPLLLRCRSRARAGGRRGTRYCEAVVGGVPVPVSYRAAATPPPRRGHTCSRAPRLFAPSGRHSSLRPAATLTARGGPPCLPRPRAAYRPRRLAVAAAAVACRECEARPTSARRATVAGAPPRARSALAALRPAPAPALLLLVAKPRVAARPPTARSCGLARACCGRGKGAGRTAPPSARGSGRVECHLPLMALGLCPFFWGGGGGQR